jgi:hypothetical protein
MYVAGSWLAAGQVAHNNKSDDDANFWSSGIPGLGTVDAKRQVGDPLAGLAVTRLEVSSTAHA